MSRVVLDTNVVISALLWDESCRHVLTAARREQVRLYTSPPLLLEIIEVLARPKFKEKVASSQLSVDEMVHGYTSLATVVQPRWIARVAIDPDDDVVLGTALAARADVITSGDAHLLSLVHFQNILILSASERLATLAHS